MRRRQSARPWLATACSATVVAAALAVGAPAAAGTSAQPQYVRSCAVAKRGYAACDALRSLRSHALAAADTATPAGYGPQDLQDAYNLTSAAATNGGDQTVAVVDAFDDPHAEADLAVYRSTYGLPPCSSDTGCFAKVPGSGSALPRTDAGWAQEESLDIDMVSAICPNCRIRLVEALSNSNSDLAKAEQAAAQLGATEISNSFGGRETSGEVTMAKNYYTYPGVVVTASNGDSGYGVEFPAASPSVVAVGGTTLNRAANARGWGETVWGSGGLSALVGGTGSGCSKYEPKPKWQKDTGCGKRMVGDVAAVADPNTGVAVYDTTAYLGSAGWMVFGGTSVSSPIIASVAALAGNAAAYPQIKPASFIYYERAFLNDVTGGSNGTCTKSYYCNGKAGYDGPTGWGTPNGIGAF